MGHALMENRHGLIGGTTATRASGHAEREAAPHLIEPHADWPQRITVGADKGFDTQDFVADYAIALTFLGNAIYAPIVIFLNERFPTALRASGTAISWNLGFTIGGTMPTWVSLTSGSRANLPLTLAIFSIAVTMIFLIGSFVVPETRGRFD